MFTCLPIDTVAGSVHTDRETPAVIEVNHQEAEWKTEQLVKVDGVSEPQPLGVFFAKW